ncbi:MAG: hypothetical protein JNK30_09535 [Phenylobacterium sp.]|uniref:hypothetical protein n=1 Tax=Phenylobacterium sp. TaxID=1871053 RepID=UPI001A40D610|nr:hypothetical protein [Phenylobacterium sp.]MBL8771610.1 hypothetical protein [Phenylobacterium sp.]
MNKLFELLDLRRVLALAAAVSAVAVAAGVVVVAAAYGVFALARIWLIPAGAAAVTAALFAAVAVTVAWIAARPVTPPKRKAVAAEDEQAGLVDRVILLARERPLIALGAAAAAAVVLVRNPAVVSAIVTAFMAGGATRPEK